MDQELIEAMVNARYNIQTGRDVLSSVALAADGTSTPLATPEVRKKASQLVSDNLDILIALTKRLKVK